MQPKNLGWKFAFVGLLVAMSVYSLWANGLRQGQDLKGGHVLVFELEGSSSGRESAEVVQHVISRLKDRIDPTGLAMLEWTPVGTRRFEVRMPMGTEEARQAKRQYLAALDRLQEDNVQRGQIQQTLSLPPAERAEAIQTLSRGGAQRLAVLQKLASAYDAMQAARKKLEALSKPAASRPAVDQAQDDLADAADAYNQAEANLLAQNINTLRLGQVLELYVSQRESESISQEQAAARTKAFGEQLDALRKEHPNRQAEIDAMVNAYKDWMEKRTGLDDPADLRRMISRAGVLEFRIAPTMPVPNQARRRMDLSEAELETYLQKLASDGPLAGRASNDEFQWFPLREGNERVSPDVVVSKFPPGAGKKYVLLSNRPDDAMLQNPDSRDWSLEAYLANDDMGRPAVGFKLDPRGAKMMGRLTNQHKDDYMAILLDNEVYSAPYIRQPIYGSGIIEGSFTLDEVRDLVRILNAGALEERVKPEPVSEKTIAPSMGEDNRRAGVRAAVWAMIGTAAFMMIYYLMAGCIADAAMFLNLLLTLGVMSFVDAVFTLPGIAGLTLSTAMAVDANVLIYERLREEQAKTQSIRLAVRNAYQNAFSAIFDSNITTLITAVILLWLGSQEVKGFAITLGLGVIFNLFTAISVTRWIFQYLMEKGLLKNRLRMMSLIGVPNIDWIGKRRAFWTFSIILSAAGLIALFTQGKDILGLEFSSGTMSSFRLKEFSMIPDPAGQGQVVPSRAAIEKDLERAATAMAAEARQQSAAARADDLQKLAQTLKVETLLASTDKADALLREFGGGDAITRQQWGQRKLPEAYFTLADRNQDGKLERDDIERLPERGYQAATTVANVDLLREVVQRAFGPVLAIKGDLNPQIVKGGVAPGLGITIDPGSNGVTYVSEDLAQKAPPTLRQKFLDFVGGGLFVVRIDAPQTEAEIVERIQTMRLQPDFATYQFNQTRVIGLEAAPGGEGYVSLAVLAFNPNTAYAGRQADWVESFAKPELNLLTQALERKETLESMQFSPRVAGETQQKAIIACVLSWVAIIAYLWLRFGSARWGLAAVIALVHDVIVAVGLVAMTAWLSKTVLGPLLLVRTAFPIDMTVMSAFLTIIGYSVNDTIVVFDRIRENRGKLDYVDAKLINRSINQTLGRTMLTGLSTLIALIVMYVWGGEGIHAFTYAMLGGFIIGTYSSIAVASPLLLGFKQALIGKIIKPAPMPEPVVGK